MEDDPPVITTIIPTYRRPRLLRRAIRSVLNQSYPHFKVAIYDNGSGDDTGQVVKKLIQKDPRISYFAHKNNIGVRANVQFARERVETPYFSILSDDDLLLSDFFETALKGFRKHPDAGFSAGRTLIMTKWGQPILIAPHMDRGQLALKNPQGLNHILKNQFAGRFCWTSILFRTDAIKQVDPFKGAEGDLTDIDFILKISAKFPILFDKKVCAIYIMNKIMDSDDTYRKCLEWIKLRSDLLNDWGIPKDQGHVVDQMLIRQLKKLIRVLWAGSVAQNKIGDAERYLRTLEKEASFKILVKFLENTGKLFRKYPVLLGGFRFFYRLWNYPKRIHQERVKRNFEEYSEYLRVGS